MKKINALCFLVVIVAAFFPIVTIAFVGDMNVIDFIIGPSQLREMGFDSSDLINPENSLLIILPAIGLICSMVSAPEKGYITSPIVCLIAAIIGNMMLSKLGKTINTFLYGAEANVGLTFMNIGYKCAIAASVLVVLQTLYNKQEVFRKVSVEKRGIIEKIKCASCGSENVKTAEFCINCGKKLKYDILEEQMIKCESCGNENEQGAEFCSSCGRKLIGEISRAQHKTCSKCGQKNLKSAEYCINCGTRLNKLICKECGSEYEQDSEFCSNCGRRVSE